MATSSSDMVGVPIFASLSRRQWIRICLVLGAVLFVSFGWLWFDRIYRSPQRVFESMLANGLSTRGVTRVIQDESDVGTLEQIETISFNGQPMSHGRSTITQSPGGDVADSKVTTETIATPEAEYVRYVELTSQTAAGQNIDYNNVVNKWAKIDVTEGASQSLPQTLFTLTPLGNLNPGERQRIVGLLKEKNAYQIDYEKVERAIEGGKAVYKYPVKLDIKAYVGVLKEHLDKMGIVGTESLDPSGYVDGQLVEIEMVVDIRSGQLRQIRYSDGIRREDYSGYGTVRFPELPTDTVSLEELNNLLNQNQVQEN